VHAGISPADVRAQVAAHPDAEILVHPECGCTTSVLDLVSSGDLPADRTRVLSTGGMVEEAARTTAPLVLVATEVGILHQLRALNEGTTFVPMNDRAACRYMKMITPEKLLSTLRTGEGAVDVDPETASRARTAVEAMIAIGEPGRGGE
jgi:quinolinate synthase